jgi:hypothetical protein
MSGEPLTEHRHNGGLVVFCSPLSSHIPIGDPGVHFARGALSNEQQGPYIISI